AYAGNDPVNKSDPNGHSYGGEQDDPMNDGWDCGCGGDFSGDPAGKDDGGLGDTIANQDESLSNKTKTAVKQQEVKVAQRKGWYFGPPNPRSGSMNPGLARTGPNYSSVTNPYGPHVSGSFPPGYNPYASGWRSNLGARNVKQNVGRQKNHLQPDPKATGNHTTYRTDSQGSVTHHETWSRNPRNPSGYDSVQRTDIVGRAHRNKSTGQSVETPHTHSKDIKGGVRSAYDNEIPGYGK
ncbi:MAG: hypothetical protein GY748_00705, partial [Planctomycetaceae bacterium]|nr:hypothetical protein [Planctomycetaceae bacterium]